MQHARIVRRTGRSRIGLPDPVRADRLGGMATESHLAELSSVLSLLEDLTERVMAVADHYRGSDASAVVVDLDAAERNLVAARRALTRATNDLG